MAVRGVDAALAPSGQRTKLRARSVNWLRRYSAHPWARPFGARAASVQKRSRRFVSEPVGVLIPLVWGTTYKQKAAFCTGSPA